jgi:hypothetical protein
MPPDSEMPLLRPDNVRSWKRAIGELSLIVSGVLIALGVDSAWQARQERQRELAYLEQLLSDARETEEGLRQSIAGDSIMLVRVERVLDQAFYNRVPARDTFSIPTGYQQFRPLTGTYTALVQNGDLRLVRGDSLRFHVIAYVALIDATEVMLRHTESLIWNSTERVQHGLIIHSRARQDNGSSSWAQLNVVGALNDPGIIGALRAHVLASRNRLGGLRSLQKPTADLIRLLQAELGRNPE